MVFPRVAIVEADPAFKAESNRWLFRLKLGRSGAASLCLRGHDNTAQWALTTFQMEMEYPVEIRHSHLDGTWWWDPEWEMEA